MHTNSQLSAIIAWAQDRGIDYTADLLDHPPALLDGIMLLTPEEQAEQGAGLCLTITTGEDSEYPGSIGFWIPPHGRKGTWSSMLDGDDEITLDYIPDFTTESELISFIDSEVTDFLSLV
jgi:hypothetical protein